MALEVVATWRGGMATDVRAREHEFRVDEPEPAGTDTGMMPTEVFCAALASCFCLAVGWAAGKRGEDVPGLRVAVRAHRPGRELRYERVEIETTAAVEHAGLARLVERAPPLCWVSNTLASGVTVEYLHTSVNANIGK